MNRDMQIKLLNEMSATDVRKCMKCGKCSGRCPAFKEMDIKPHQFVTLLGQGALKDAQEELLPPT